MYVLTEPPSSKLPITSPKTFKALSLLDMMVKILQNKKKNKEDKDYYLNSHGYI